MPPIESLRGRHFTWEERGGSVAIIEASVVVGQVMRLSERPAELADERLFIEHSVGVLGPAFEVRNTASGAVLARSHDTRDAEMRAMSGDRAYRLRSSNAIAVWSNEEDAVSLRIGEAFVLMGADPAVATPLLLLGIVMALEGSLVSRAEGTGLLIARASRPSQTLCLQETRARVHPATTEKDVGASAQCEGTTLSDP